MARWGGAAFLCLEIWCSDHHCSPAVNPEQYSLNLLTVTSKWGYSAARSCPALLGVMGKIRIKD